MSGITIGDQERRMQGAGTVGRFDPLREGTPAEIAAAHKEQNRQLAIARARHAGHVEYASGALEYVPRARIWLDEERDRILEKVDAPEADADMIVGFQIGSDGWPIYFKKADRGGLPSTVFMWRVQQDTIASRRRSADLDARTALITTPLEPVTLAELQGVDTLPTPKTAAEIVLESGKLELVGDRLRVHLRVRGDRELEATRVLYAAEPIVVAALKAAGKQKQVSLPDVQVLAGGGIA